MSLSNVTMEELGIKPKCIPDKNLLPIGYKVPINLLKTLSKKESPKEKYDTLVAVSDEIVKTVHKNLEILKIEAELGADDLFPIFLYVVIKSKLSYMYSEFKYLLDFLDESVLVCISIYGNFISKHNNLIDLITLKWPLIM
jgi:hypothetical protein